MYVCVMYLCMYINNLCAIVYVFMFLRVYVYAVMFKRKYRYAYTCIIYMYNVYINM